MGSTGLLEPVMEGSGGGPTAPSSSSWPGSGTETCRTGSDGHKPILAPLVRREAMGSVHKAGSKAD